MSDREEQKGIIALNHMSSAPRDKWIILFNEFTGFWLSRWSDEKKSYPLYDFEFSDGVWYPSPLGWLSLCHQPKAAIFSKMPVVAISELVKPLEWDNLGDNKLRSGPYSITLRGDGKYRVRFRKKVICDAVNDLRRAKSIADERNISRVLHLLTIKEGE